MGVAESRDAALALVEKYHNPRMADRAFDLAWTHSQVTLRHLNASEADAQLYARLSGALIYAHPRPACRFQCVAQQPARAERALGLWHFRRLADRSASHQRLQQIEIVQQLIRAHSYWRMKGLTVDLVILNEDVSVYRQPLQEQFCSLIASGIEAQTLDKPGGIFVRRLEQISAEDRVLLQSVARLVLADDWEP